MVAVKRAIPIFWNGQNLRESANLTRFLFPCPKSHKILDGIITIAQYFFTFFKVFGASSDSNDNNELVHIVCVEGGGVYRTVQHIFKYLS